MFIQPQPELVLPLSLCRDHLLCVYWVMSAYIICSLIVLILTVDHMDFFFPSCNIPLHVWNPENKSFHKAKNPPNISQFMHEQLVDFS